MLNQTSLLIKSKKAIPPLTNKISIMLQKGVENQGVNLSTSLG